MVIPQKQLPAVLDNLIVGTHVTWTHLRLETRSSHIMFPCKVAFSFAKFSYSKFKRRITFADKFICKLSKQKIHLLIQWYCLYSMYSLVIFWQCIINYHLWSFKFSENVSMYHAIDPTCDIFYISDKTKHLQNL